jgi:tetratricopeptide (TPR) repeat protein
MSHLANSYAQVGRHAEAIQLSDEALTLGEAKLAPDHPVVMAIRNNLACHLATPPNSAPHDAQRAVELAEKNIELAPNEGDYWNTFGIARYRAGHWNSAVAAFQKSLELRDSGSDFFFLAMAHWQLGHTDEARNWHEKAVEWMENNSPDNDELRRFRAEAADLLGIPEALPSASPQPSKNETPTTDNSTAASPPSTGN